MVRKGEFLERSVVVKNGELTLDALYHRGPNTDFQLGYRTVEVPVTKIYPPKQVGQTKMKPIAGWWSILRPLVYVGLGLRK